MKTRTGFIKCTALAGILVLAGCAPYGSDPYRATKSLSAAEIRRANELNDRLEAKVLDEVYFGFNKASLGAASRDRLDRAALFIVENPQVKFNVIGHADAVGSNRYNRALGMRRAHVAVAYLIRKGVSFEQLMATVSLGEDELAVQTDRREVMNRRVVIEVMDFLTRPVKYANYRGRPYPVWPPEAVNSPDNVCGGGDLADLCASASLLNLMDLEASLQVSRDLQVELGLLGDLDLTNPDGTLEAGLDSTVGGIVETTVDVTGDLGDTVGDTVDSVGDTVGDVGDTVGGLLGG